MATITGNNRYTNLFNAINRKTVADREERLVGRVPLDLRYKGEAPITNVLTCKVSQLNGKKGDLQYAKILAKSRPYA